MREYRTGLHAVLATPTCGAATLSVVWVALAVLLSNEVSTM